MKHFFSLLTGFFVSCIVFNIAFNLSSCSVNTKFDDADYRPVGASAPLNSEVHTLEETRPVSEAVEEVKDNGNTRYVKPGQEAQQIPHKSTHVAPLSPPTASQATPDIKSPDTKKASASQSAAESHPAKLHSQTPLSRTPLSKTIGQLFNTRYGQPETIIKISKTVQIHCDKQANSNSNSNSKLQNTDFKVCRYQFPAFCGAHQFSVIFNNDKQILMYIDRKYQRNIIDTLSGTQQSAPGLWDKDDYVSSKLLTIDQLLNKNSANTSNNSSDLGWIIAISPNEKAQLGRSYSNAIKETSKCF